MRYTLALEHLRTDCVALDAQATWTGLWALARSLNAA
jgi:hypothetical protein